MNHSIHSDDGLEADSPLNPRASGYSRVDRRNHLNAPGQHDVADNFQRHGLTGTHFRDLRRRRRWWWRRRWGRGEPSWNSADDSFHLTRAFLVDSGDYLDRLSGDEQRRVAYLTERIALRVDEGYIEMFEGNHLEISDLSVAADKSFELHGATFGGLCQEGSFHNQCRP